MHVIFSEYRFLAFYSVTSQSTYESEPFRKTFLFNARGLWAHGVVYTLSTCYKQTLYMLYEHYFFAQICGSFSMNVKKGPQNNNLQGVQRDTDSGSKNYRPKNVGHFQSISAYHSF